VFSAAKLGPLPDLYFHRVRADSDEADDNIVRLFFEKECTPRIFADLFDGAEDLSIGTSVKLGICWKLSASFPNTYQRALALPQALGDLCTCLDDFFESWIGPITADRKEFTSRLRRQLADIVDSPGFLNLTSDVLY
jgi:hypothetical protein